MPATDMNSCYQVSPPSTSQGDRTDEQMCQAQYGSAGLSAPPSGSAPPPSGSAPASPATSAAAGATGAPAPDPPANGTAGSKTHTIIVAPTQGVLRFGMYLPSCPEGG
jgi:hypothetical protein